MEIGRPLLLERRVVVMKIKSRLAVMATLMSLSVILPWGKATGATEAQTVTGSWYWMNGASTTQSSGGRIDPLNLSVSPGGSGTMTAKPKTGEKALKWMRYVGPNQQLPSSFTEIGNAAEPLVWTESSLTYGTSVIIGLVCDWIKYSIAYEGQSTHNDIIYTNKVKIAICDTTRTGYTFVNWTNQVVTLSPSTSVTGEKFKLTNHDDSAVVKLYPKWKANQYQVTLDPQGGTGGGTITATYDSSLGSVTPPTRTGYTFKGYWTQAEQKGTKYYDANGQGLQAWKETAVNRLYAGWDVNSYAVTISATGPGKVSPTSGNYPYGKELTLTATPDNEGAYFVKWSDGNTENPRTVTVEDAITYTAEFGTQCYTVRWLDASTFGSNVLKTETIDWGKNATAPDQPSHDGYTFLNWTSDGRDVRQNRDISAQYQANTYTVRLNPNGGQGNAKDVGFTYGTPGNLPSNQFRRTGYRFAGWGTNKTEVAYEDGAQVLNWATQGTVELYAIWEANAFTVVYETKAGEGSMEAQAFRYDEPQNLTSNKFVNGELGFLRWTCSNGKTYLDGELVSNLTDVANGVVTNTAVWATTYFVEFDGNGATSGTMQRQKFSGPDDEQALTANGFVKTGYAFQGWAKSREDAAQHRNLMADRALVKGLTSEAGATVTLYAAWEAITYYVAFATDASGVQLSEPPVLTLQYDEETVLPEYSSYFAPKQVDLDTFKAWRDDVNGVTYANGATVSNLCTTAQATNVLVATWKLDVGEWSEHMHCTTLKWSSVERGTPDWEMKDGVQWGCTNTGACVRQEGGSWNTKDWLQTVIRTNGVLRFACKWMKAETSEAETMKLGVGFVLNSEAIDFNDSGIKSPMVTFELDTPEEWTGFEVPVTLPAGESQLVIRLANYIGKANDYVEIDQMRWIPEGGGDEPTEDDAPTVTGFAFVNGKLVLTSSSDKRFDYRVLTTTSLEAPVTWLPDATTLKPGADGSLSFEMTVDPAEPQRFYRVEVLQKTK